MRSVFGPGAASEQRSTQNNLEWLKLEKLTHSAASLFHYPGAISNCQKIKMKRNQESPCESQAQPGPQPPKQLGNPNRPNCITFSQWEYVDRCAVSTSDAMAAGPQPREAAEFSPFYLLGFPYSIHFASVDKYSLTIREVSTLCFP